MGKCDFLRRLTCIEHEIVAPRYEKMKQGQLDKAREPFSVRLKPFWDIAEVRKVRIMEWSTISFHDSP